MNKDYTASRSITIDAKDKITLDLGGNTLYMNGVNDVIDGTSSRSTTIFNQGNLTIKNGNLSITSAVKKAINGIVNAEGAVLTVEPTANLYTAAISTRAPMSSSTSAARSTPRAL